MTSIKLAIIIFAYMTCAKAEFHNITSQNLTHIIKNSFYDAEVLKVQNQLFYVSYFKVNSNVTIRLESNVIPTRRNSCLITFPLGRHNDLIAPRAKILGNEKLVVALFMERGQDVKSIVTIYVINFYKDCTYKDYEFPLHNEGIQTYEPFRIIPYQDTFDIFVKSYVLCKPSGSICRLRFNDKAEILDNLDFDFPTSNSSLDLVKIYPLREFDSSEGYVFFSEHTSTVKILHANLTVIKEIKLKGFILAQSVLNDDIGVCFYVDEIEPHTDCLKLDSRLKTKTNISLSNSHDYAARRLYNLADGSSLILTIARGKIRTHLRRLSVDGKISESELYKYDCESITTNPFVQFVELKGGNYCFSFGCMFKTITHCVSSSDAKQLFSNV